MRTILCFPLMLVALSWADKLKDHAAIERVMAALNEPQSWHDAKPISKLCTADADIELHRFSKVFRRLLEASRKPWSETSTPRFAIQSIRFVTPGVALVDAAIKQYGSVILVRRVPVLFVMKKEGTDWRIASLRVLSDLGVWPSDP